MAQDKVQVKIPRQIRLKTEFFIGFGMEELIKTLIVGAVAGVIAYILYKITNQTILATLLVIGAIFSINIEPIDNAQLIEHLDARIRDASSLSKIAKNESIKQVREAEVKEASEIAPFFTIQKDLTEYFKRNILTSSFTGGFLFNTNTFIDKESYCF